MSKKDNPSYLYLRTQRVGQVRLTVSSFLAGITFASLAALMVGDPIPGLETKSLVADLVRINRALIDALLGSAGVLFLLSTLSCYRALQLLSGLPVNIQRLLEQSIDLTNDHPALTAEAVSTRLTDAYAIFHEAGRFIPYGVVAVMLSVILIGIYIAWPVGMVLVLVLALGLKSSQELRSYVRGKLSVQE